MKLRTRVSTALVGAAVVAAGIFLAPPAAGAYGISQCALFVPTNHTYAQATCDGSFLDSDVYAAHVTCDGHNLSSGNYVTPLFGGWGQWARVNCPDGFTNVWYTTGD